MRAIVALAGAAVLPFLAACRTAPAPVREVALTAAPATLPMIDGRPPLGIAWTINGRTATYSSTRKPG